MKVFGLTGGIGMGKSTSAHLLRSRGIPVIDTDDLARQIVEPGQASLAEVVAEFGPGILAADGGLRRKELARLVFADPAARVRLEKILHPRIHELWHAQIETWNQKVFRFRSWSFPCCLRPAPKRKWKQPSARHAVLKPSASGCSLEPGLPNKSSNVSKPNGRLSAKWRSPTL